VSKAGTGNVQPHWEHAQPVNRWFETHVSHLPMFLPAVDRGKAYRGLAMLRSFNSVNYTCISEPVARQGPQKRGFPIDLITAKPGDFSPMVQECAPRQY